MTRRNNESVILDKRLLNYNLLNYSYNKKTMDWGQLLSGSAIGGVLVELIRYLRERRKEKNLASTSLIKLNEIYSKCMKLVLDETPADRFVIFKAENGGGKIVPGVQLFASVLYEDYRNSAGRALLDKYQRWMCDKHFIEMLMQLSVKGSIKFSAHMLDEDSKFRNVCAAENMLTCEMHFIAQRSDKLFYCLITSSQKDPELNLMKPSDRNNIDISIDRLRNIFKESVKYM